MDDNLKTLLEDIQSKDGRISRPSLPRMGKPLVPSRLTGGECLGILAHLEPKIARRDRDVLVNANVARLRLLVKEHCANFAERLRSRESSPTRVLDQAESSDDSEGEEPAVADEESLKKTSSQEESSKKTSDEKYLKKTLPTASSVDSASSDGTTTVDVAVVNADMSNRDETLKGNLFHDALRPFLMQDKDEVSSPNHVSLGVFSEMPSKTFANNLVETLNRPSVRTYDHVTDKLTYDWITQMYDTKTWEFADRNVRVSEVSNYYKYQAVKLRHIPTRMVVKSFAVHLPHKKEPRPEKCIEHILNKIEEEKDTEEVDANIIIGDKNTTPEKIREVVSEFNGCFRWGLLQNTWDIAIPDNSVFTTTNDTSKDNLIIDDGVLSFEPGLIQDRGILLHHIPMIKRLRFAEN
jgi:hypothetical protein